MIARAGTTVVREGREQAIDPGEVVRDDILVVRPGDRIVVDGPIVGSSHIEVDESLLSGESDLVTKRTGETLYSDSFCVLGEAHYRVERIGEESFVNGLTATARRYRRSLTLLQREVNVIICVILLVAIFLELILLIGAPIHHISLAAGAKMSVVIAKLGPAGLFLSVTLAYALGALRTVRRGALVQQVNAVESLSNVDVLCLDKTGTLTANMLALQAVHPIGIGEADLRQALGEYAASTTGGNLTIAALKEACPAEARPVGNEVPFSSEWKWSALTFDGRSSAGTYVLGAAVALSSEVETLITTWTAQGWRVLLFAHAPHAAALRDERVSRVCPMDSLPLVSSPSATNCAHTPAQKEGLITLVRQDGHYVAMIGDGVNDGNPVHRARGLNSLTGTDYLVIASIVVLWAMVLRFTWRARLLDRFLGVDLQLPPQHSRTTG
jgi:cation-transporting P-type ATPase E